MWGPVDAAVWLMSRRLERRGPPPGSHADVDTASLRRRFPHLADVTVTDVAISGPHGPVPARLYRAPGETRTGFVWTHGGAFVGGDLDMPESNWVGLELAARGIPTLTVDYHKALRGVRYPVPADDVLAAWRHATAVSGELFGVAAERLQLGGASAGGTLAADVALRLHDGAGIRPASLVLAYALLHSRLPAPSADARAAAARLTGILRFRPWVVRTLARHYAGRRHVDDGGAFAGLADDLTGLPPTYLLVAAIDDLRPSSEEFDRRLTAAGVPHETFVERSATHGHLNHPDAASAQRSIARIATWLERHA